MRPIDADALYEDMLYEMCSTGFQTNALSVIRRAPTIAPSPNEPLTLEELRKMDGDPVWVVPLDGRNNSGWMLVDMRYGICQEAHGGIVMLGSYGKTWLAYRRRPEEGTI